MFQVLWAPMTCINHIYYSSYVSCVVSQQEPYPSLVNAIFKDTNLPEAPASSWSRAVPVQALSHMKHFWGQGKPLEAVDQGQRLVHFPKPPLSAVDVDCWACHASGHNHRHRNPPLISRWNGRISNLQTISKNQKILTKAWLSNWTILAAGNL